MSAEPDTDRSLTADNKPATEPEAPAAAQANGNIQPASQPGMAVDATSAAGQDTKAGTADATAAPDLSGLTREQLEARIKSLTEDLTAANAESEIFRQQWQDLKLRDEALGVEAINGDESKLEEKHVEAMKELYQSEMKRREALLLLGKLLDTTGQMLQTAPNYDPKLRSDYEVAARAAKEYLAGHSGASIPLGASLSEGQISDVNPQLNAVILNVGKSQGVKEGMPFLLFQGDVEVGTAKVVLARELVSAALVQSLKPNTVLKVGDRAAVDAQQ